MVNYDEYKEPPQSNTLGLVGFVLSVTCCLSPLGLILSLIALFKAPRGFAIAGLIIGALFSAMFGSGVIFAYKLSQEVNVENPIDGMAYLIDWGQLQEAVDQMDRSEDLVLSLTDIPATTDAKTDPWGKEYRLQDLGESRDLRSNLPARLYRLTSAGPDGIFDNDDDPRPQDAPKDSGLFVIAVVQLTEVPVTEPEVDEPEVPENK